MRLTTFLGAAALALGLAVDAPAATIGSLDETRVLTRTALDTGNKRDELRAAIAGAGHTVAASQSTLTAAFLAGLDVFYTSTLTFGAAGALNAAEQAVLQSWVSGGGIVFSTGEQASSTTQPNYNTVLNPFGISVASVAAFGQGVFVNDPANA